MKLTGSGNTTNLLACKAGFMSSIQHLLVVPCTNQHGVKARDPL